MSQNLTIDVLDAAGHSTGTLELPQDIFGREVNIPLMHQVVVAQQAAARQGTHSVKTRGMVSGGGRKPWRQKGTGRARQGSIRAPQWKGGGVVHGPQPRDYSQRTPKKMKVAALRSALSDRARAGRIHAVTQFIDADKPSTKLGRASVERIASQRRVLVVLTRDEELQGKSIRNLPQVHLLFADQLNTYDVLVNEDVIFTKAGFDAFVNPSRPEEQEA